MDMTARSDMAHRLRILLAAAATTIAIGACAGQSAKSPGAAAASPSRATTATYFPEPGAGWQRRRATDVGMDSAVLAQATAFAQAHDINWSRDMAEQLRTNTAREPYPEILGPFKDRGTQNGVVIRHGYIVAEWGDTERVDMTFSVAKSYLSTVFGLAVDRGLVKSVDEPVRNYIHDGGYDSPHNAPITWYQTFNQTSEWEGVLWDKPDRADRRAGYDRELKAPGTFWEYNDVRVNRAALSTLRVWKKPLPEVLRDEINDAHGHPAGVWLHVVAEHGSAPIPGRDASELLRVRGRREHDLDRSGGRSRGRHAVARQLAD
jgi:CubicO group peptidase (beta-lactamase class C family)